MNKNHQFGAVDVPLKFPPQPTFATGEGGSACWRGTLRTLRQAAGGQLNVMGIADPAMTRRVFSNGLITIGGFPFNRDTPSHYPNFGLAFSMVYFINFKGCPHDSVETPTIHGVLSRSVLRNQVLRNNFLSHNVHRNNCCNVSFIVSSLFRLFRFGASCVHNVSCAYGPQVHWHCARALHALAFWQGDF